MAVCVVDLLETIDVEIDERQSALTPLRLFDGHAQSVGQEDPVGNAGQRVVMRHVLEALLVFLQFGDVRNHPHVM